MIGIQTVRDAFQSLSFEITGVSLVCSEYSIADILKKGKAQSWKGLD